MARSPRSTETSAAPSPLAWPVPPPTETAAFSHLERTTAAVEPHTHPHFQLVIPARGKIRCELAETSFEVGPPEAIVLWPEVTHAFGAPRGPVEMFAVQATAEALRSAAHMTGFELRRPVQGYLKLSRVPVLLRELVFELVHHREALAPGARGSALASLTYPYFCLQLVDRISREGARAASPTDARTFRSEYVDRTVHLLRAELSSPLHLGELARRVGTSPRNLTREFQKELKTSPVKYLQRLRLERAAEVLASTDQPVKEIAFQLGYASVPRFTTAFKQLHAVTPLEHRERARRR